MADAVGEQPGSNGKKLGGCTGKGFMPGQSGNPAGRQPGSGLTDMIRKALAANDATWGTKADKLIALCLEHAEKGDFRYFKEVIDRMDGPLPSRSEVTGPNGGPVQVAYKVVEGECWGQA